MITTAWTDKNWKTRFFTIWGGQAFSLLGSRLVQFAIIWWLTQTTGSATVLAIASLVGLLPDVIFGPIIGTLVDRWNRRWIMIAADSLIAAATLVLAYLYSVDAVSLWIIYVLLFIRSIGGSFHRPAMTSSTSLMVPEEHFTRVQGINQMLNGGLGIIAAPLGALLLEVLAMQGIVMVDVITALLAILPLLFINIPQPEPTQAEISDDQKPSVWEDFRIGLKYVLGWPGMIMLMGLAMVVNFLLAPTGALTPLLVTDHFQGGAAQLALTQSAVGLGAVVGGLVLGAWGGFKKRILTTMIGLLGLGLAFGAMGFIPAAFFPLAVLCIFVAGVTLPFINGPIGAIMQATVDPKMQGRVFSLLGSLSSAMSPLGLIIAGPISDHFGIHSWFIFGGILTLSMGVLGLLIPAIMNIEEDSRAKQANEEMIENIEGKATVTA